MSVSKVPITLYYDVVSPYSWIAFEALLRYEQVWPIKIQLKPFLMGAVIKSVGANPPLFNEVRKANMARDLARNNKFYNLNLKFPDNFKEWVTTKNSVNASRLLTAIKKHQPEMEIPVARQFWKRLWTDSKPIYDVADFKEVMTITNLKDQDGLLKASQSDEIKEIVKKNTQEAMSGGACGGPWIVVDYNGEKHGFFGSDRMHLIGHLIGQTFTTGQNHLAAEI